MKKQIWLIPLFLFLSFSCSDDSNQQRKITTVKAASLESDYGKIKLRWLNPTSTDLSHIEVSYKDENQELKTLTITDWIGDPTSGVSECSIEVLLDDEHEREFEIIAYTKKEISSEPVILKGKAKPLKANLILEEIQLFSYLDGVLLYWNSEAPFSGTVHFDYMETDGSLVSKQVSLSSEGRKIIKEVPTNLTEYSLFVVDEDNRASSNTKRIKAKVLSPNIEKLDRSKWMVESFSSEEKDGEQPYFGYASNVLDGNYDSYWHTRYVGGFLPYPHSLVIDMNEITLLDTISMIKRRRAGGSWGHHKLFQLETSYDNIHWEYCGEFINTWNRPNDVEEMYVLENRPIGRYFKFTALEGNSPSTLHTHIAEIYAYGMVTGDSVE